MIFAGEAYNVEMGISNELFTQDRPLPGEDQLGSGLPGNCLNSRGPATQRTLPTPVAPMPPPSPVDVGLFNVFIAVPGPAHALRYLAGKCNLDR